MPRTHYMAFRNFFVAMGLRNDFNILRRMAYFPHVQREQTAVPTVHGIIPVRNEAIQIHLVSLGRRNIHN